jgi:FkbM family methyltransferase
MMLRAWLRDRLRARGYVWFRKPHLPWGLDLQSDLERWFDLDAFTCVVDVGAHVGKLSLQFARMCPQARVFAFEMVPGTFEQLQKNVSGVGRICPQCVGLSDESGATTLAVEPDSQQNSLRNRASSAPNQQTVAVELRRLDDIAPAWASPQSTC